MELSSLMIRKWCSSVSYFILLLSEKLLWNSVIFFFSYVGKPVLQLSQKKKRLFATIPHTELNLIAELSAEAAVLESHG